MAEKDFWETLALCADRSLPVPLRHKMLGRGGFGQVYETENPAWVCKITDDAQEARFWNSRPSVCFPITRGVYKIDVAKFAIWRRAVQPLELVGPEPTERLSELALEARRLRIKTAGWMAVRKFPDAHYEGASRALAEAVREAKRLVLDAHLGAVGTAWLDAFERGWILWDVERKNLGEMDGVIVIFDPTGPTYLARWDLPAIAWW